MRCCCTMMFHDCKVRFILLDGSVSCGVRPGVIKGHYPMSVNINVDVSQGPGSGPDLTEQRRYKQKWSAAFPLSLSFFPKPMLKSWRSVQSTQKIKQPSHLIVCTLKDCHQIQCASCIPLAPGTCIVHEHYLRSFDNIHAHFLRNQYISPLCFSLASQKLKKENKILQVSMHTFYFLALHCMSILFMGSGVLAFWPV